MGRWCRSWTGVGGKCAPWPSARWRQGARPGTVRCEELSYFSRLADAATFTTLAAGEVHRRGVETAGRVAGVVDGSGWCQQFFDVHRPDAIRILDFPHGAQRLTAVAEAVWGPREPGRTWATTQRRELRDGDPGTVLASVRALAPAAASDPATAAQVQAEVLGYLEPRLPQMHYAAFRAQGLPIGSGIVESANKVVVEARLKGAGRRWAEPNVNPMVALRGALCSGRWDETWAAIAGARCRPAPVPRPRRRPWPGRGR